MRAIRIIGVHFGWAFFSMLMLALTKQQLESRIRTMEGPRVDIEFSEPASQYSFSDPSNAEFPLTISLSLPSQVDINAQLKGDTDFFDFQPDLRVPAGEQELTTMVRLRKLPSPDSQVEKSFELAAAIGPAVVQGNQKHIVTIGNSRLLPAELTVIAPPSPIELTEPRNAVAESQSSFSVELRVEPPRRATVELRLDQNANAAKLGEDFVVTGIRHDNERYYVDVPAVGTAKFIVSAIRNSASTGTSAKKFKFQLASSAGDSDLAIRSAAIEGQITDSDRAKLRITAEKDLKLYESSISRVVNLKIEAITPLPSPVEIEVRENRSPGLSSNDYSLQWSPSNQLSNSESVELQVAAIDDSQSEQGEVLSLEFPDSARYEIEGDRQFDISIVDDDRKLLAGLDTQELYEGGESTLELKFDPPDTKPTVVQLSIGQGDPDRFRLSSLNGNPLPTSADAEGRRRYQLTAPGKYTVSVLENAELQKRESIRFEFPRTPIAEFQIPKPLDLTIHDDESTGEVLVVVLATKYVLESAQQGKEISPTFLNRFKGIRTLPNNRKLVGGGVFVVGRSTEASPRYLNWKGDKAELSEFMAQSALVTNDEVPFCLEDCLHTAASFAKHFRDVRSNSDSVDLVVVWASGEPPRSGIQGDSCRENSFPDGISFPADKSHFVWMGTDERVFYEFFQKDSELLAPFYRLFPRQEANLLEIQENSDATLAIRIGSMLSPTPNQ